MQVDTTPYRFYSVSELAPQPEHVDDDDADVDVEEVRTPLQNVQALSVVLQDGADCELRPMDDMPAGEWLRVGSGLDAHAVCGARPDHVNLLSWHPAASNWLYLTAERIPSDADSSPDVRAAPVALAPSADPVPPLWLLGQDGVRRPAPSGVVLIQTPSGAELYVQAPAPGDPRVALSLLVHGPRVPHEPLQPQATPASQAFLRLVLHPVCGDLTHVQIGAD
jgi:hypothetical protein